MNETVGDVDVAALGLDPHPVDHEAAAAEIRQVTGALGRRLAVDPQERRRGTRFGRGHVALERLHGLRLQFGGGDGNGEDDRRQRTHGNSPYLFRKTHM